MATETLTFRADTREAIRSIEGLKTAIGGIITGAAIAALTQFGDEVTKINNRLRVLTPEIEKVNQQFNALAAIAIASRTPLESVNDLYFRIARNVDQLGISTAEAAQITETIAKGLTSTGIGAKEAAGPLLQLGQALQSGTFQGDELRSILEGMPIVAKALAKELDVPIGALRKLGSEGKISSQIFIEAMRNARDSIDEAFGRTAPTIEQSMTNLKTSVQVAFNEVDKQTGVSGRFALAIEYLGYQVFLLSRNLGPFLEKLKLVFQVLGAIAGALIFRKIVLALGGISGAFSAVVTSTRGVFTAFGILFTYLGNLGRYLSGVRLGVVTLGEVFAPLGKILALIGTRIGTVVSAIAGFFGIDKIIESFKEFTDEGGAASEALAEYRAELEKLREGLPDEAGIALPAVDLGGGEKLQTRLDNLRDKIREIAVDYAKFSDELAATNEQLLANTQLSEDQIRVNEAILDVRNRASEAIREYVDIFENLKADEQSLKPIILEQIKAIMERAAADEESAARSVASLNEYAAAQRALARNIDYIAERNREMFEIAQIEEQISLIGLYGDELKQQQMILEVTQQLKQKLLDIDTQELRLIQQRIQLGEEEFQRQMDALEALREKAYEVAGARVDAENKVLEAQKKNVQDWQGALKQQLEDLAESVSPAKVAVDLFGSVVDSVDQALTDFVEKGKFSFKEFARSIIKDMALIVARALIMRAVLAAVGMIFPGAATGLSALMNAAPKRFGGQVDPGNPYLVGEAGPELFMPKSAGTIVPNNQLMQPSQTQVTYNINAVDASSFRSLLARDPQYLFNVTEVGRRSSPARRLA